MRRRAGTRIGAGARELLVGDQLRLEDDPDRLVDGLDLVADRGDRALGERHQAGRADPDRLMGRGGPLGAAPQHAVAQVEHALMAVQRSVAHVKRRVADEQADDLAVGDVDDRLALLGIAVPGLGVGERRATSQNPPR